MPLLGPKKKSKDKLFQNQQPNSVDPPMNNEEENECPENDQLEDAILASQHSHPPPPKRQPKKLIFHCQLAQGSPTGIISGFTNVKQLYQRIADTYDIPVTEILFCTLNTHKVDMDMLLGGQIALDDFIFAHMIGQPKEMTVCKNENALGLTITDNGAGYAFIKRIKEGSIMDKINLCSVGDHIAKIDDESMVGKRHFEVAKILKDISIGSKFTLRLVAPIRSGFGMIAAPKSSKGDASLGSGKETLRLKSKGNSSVQISSDVVSLAADKIDNLLETYMGINDKELSFTIWEMGHSIDNPSDFCSKMQQSDLAEFCFSDDFIFDLWGAINDAKNGRVQKPDVVASF